MGFSRSLGIEAAGVQGFRVWGLGFRVAWSMAGSLISATVATIRNALLALIIVPQNPSSS